MSFIVASLSNYSYFLVGRDSLTAIPPAIKQSGTAIPEARCRNAMRRDVERDAAAADGTGHRRCASLGALKPRARTWGLSSNDVNPLGSYTTGVTTDSWLVHAKLNER
jgi:hypothetical protein